MLKNKVLMYCSFSFTPSKIIKEIKRFLKNIYERLIFGCCEIDAWNGDIWLAKNIINLCERLKEQHFGYPAMYADNDAWESELLTVKNKFTTLLYYIENNTAPNPKNFVQSLNEYTNECFMALAKIYPNLWD